MKWERDTYKGLASLKQVSESMAKRKENKCDLAARENGTGSVFNERGD